MAKVIKKPLLVLPTLMLLIGFGPISMELYIPSLTSIAHDLDSSVRSVQLSITLYPIGYGLGQLILGPLSDMFGRKKILYASGLVFFIATAIDQVQKLL